MKQTETMRIAYNWAERNGVGPILHYGSRQWETGDDEDEALTEACSGLQTPATAIPEKDYPHRDILSPGPNKFRVHNPVEIVAVCFALEIIAGLIWMVLR